MKILFISRAYPPIVGGIENQNYELAKWLGKIANVKIIANTRGRAFLPIFAPYALLQAIFHMRKYDLVLFGDGTLALLGWILKLFSKKPIVCVIHGLDINYDSKSLGVWYENILVFLYKKLWIDIFIKSFDKLIAVGNETIRVAREKGIAPDKLVFIPNGVDTEKHHKPMQREELQKVLGKDISGKNVILTSGRLAKRKGVAWFIENVMPILDSNTLYVVAGSGPDKQNIEQAIAKQNLSQRVLMLGYVTDDVRDILMNTCDLFIQPNIKVVGDMEGFGISVIEAASCERVVIASKLEGLQDAIKDGKNGFLIQPHDPDAFAEKIKQLLGDENLRKQFGAEARAYVIENYSWSHVSKQYLNEIQQIIS